MTGLRHKTVNTFWIFVPPGGKTTHILEVAPEAQVVAVDIDEQRPLSGLRQFKTPWYEGDRETR